jgi:regulator of sirC expression with transglutaminase-like and TPR domain
MMDLNKHPDGLPDHQVRALVQLLSDESTDVSEAIQTQILALGARAVPYLHDLLDDRNGVLRNEAARMILCIRREVAAEEFEVFCNRDVDLEEGAFLLAKGVYPDLDVQTYRQDLDGIAMKLKEDLRERNDDDATLRIVNHTLFVKLGFRGDTDNYTDPENSYIHRVLDRKMGIPISLSAVYLFLARRLGLPFFGVGLPGHFIVGFRGKRRTLFTDPFHSGQLLSREQCIHFITRSGQHWHEDYLAKTEDREILARMIRNLIASYKNLGETDLEKQFSGFLRKL